MKTFNYLLISLISITTQFASTNANAAQAGGIMLRQNGALTASQSSSQASGTCATYEVVHVNGSGAQSVPLDTVGNPVDIKVIVSGLPAGCVIYRSGCSGYSYGNKIPIYGASYSQPAKFFDLVCNSTVTGSFSLLFANNTIAENTNSTLVVSTGTSSGSSSGGSSSSSSSSSSGGASSSSSSSSSGASSSGGSTGLPSNEKGMWVWKENGLDWLNNTTNRTNLFNFATQKGINTMYIDVESDVSSNTTNLRSFVEAGALLGFKFRFLLGSAGAISNSRAVNFVANTSNFKNTLSAAGQSALMGVQYDVETYVNGGDPAALAPIAIAVRSAQQSQYSNILVDFCIPRWFDGKTYNTRKLSEVIQDNSDIVTLMDYVVTNSTIVADAQTEVTYAKNTGKKTVVGLETICSVPTSQSFCTRGTAALNSALNYLDTYIVNQQGYGGHAVHFYGSYRNLGP